MPLNAKETKEAAENQKNYSYQHRVGIKVPKFLTCVMTFKDEVEKYALNCYMVSDQCQALVQANVFAAVTEDESTELIARKANQDEIVPSFIMSGKTV